MKKMEKFDVGVIVGRFQIDELHDAHKELIEYVMGRHDRTIIFLGTAPCKCTVNNPLDFEARKQMLLAEYSDKITVLYIMDKYSDYVWSENLDQQIENVTGPQQTICLYGGRDSFISHYHGRFETEELEQTVFVSGSDRRKRLSNKVKADPAFRHGVIWATQNQYPKCFPTIDVAIIDFEKNKILLGRKKDEDKYRFIGGFVMPGDSFEDSVKREAMEETGLEIDDLEYIGSFPINDWRYRSEVDKITTSFFIAKKIFGRPQPGDDICEVRWFEIDGLMDGDIIDNHRPLLEAVLTRLGKDIN